MTSGDLTLDSSSRQVKRGDKDISLTAKEFDILEYLMQKRERCCPAINFQIISGTTIMTEGPCDRCVYVHLRRKVDDGFDEKKIVTVKGAGYMIK